jgi:ABC-type uncharacterized transport system auxiliary subunit
MKTLTTSAAVALSALCACATGCALLFKAEPFTPRYFSVEPGTAASPPAARSGAPRPAKSLRLGRVTAASYLGERLVYRKSKRELAYYEDLRWTEHPDAYFRRALVRTLFGDARFGQVVAGAGPTLDADLVEFTEVLAPAHVARVRVTYALFDGRMVLSGGTLTTEVAISAAQGDAEAPAVVEAMSAALDQVVAGVAERVSDALDALNVEAPSSAGSAGTP